jgi:hypothetical protein
MAGRVVEDEHHVQPGEYKVLELLKTKLPWPAKVDSELASGATTVVDRVDYDPQVPVCRP